MRTRLRCLCWHLYGGGDLYDKKKRIKVIDQEKCVKCNTCLVACPPQYDAVIKLSPPDRLPKST